MVLIVIAMVLFYVVVVVIGVDELGIWVSHGIGGVWIMMIVLSLRVAAATWLIVEILR